MDMTDGTEPWKQEKGYMVLDFARRIAKIAQRVVAMAGYASDIAHVVQATMVQRLSRWINRQTPPFEDRYETMSRLERIAERLLIREAKRRARLRLAYGLSPLDDDDCRRILAPEKPWPKRIFLYHFIETWLLLSDSERWVLDLVGSKYTAETIALILGVSKTEVEAIHAQAQAKVHTTYSNLD